MNQPVSAVVNDRTSGRVEPIGRLDDLLALPRVIEELEIRSTVGVCALHGGGLERATEVVAREVAERTGSSYYAVIQPHGCRRHLPSTRFTAGTSDRLDAFLDRVETVVSIHGYGRHDDFWAVLVGGANRTSAHHVAGHLRGILPEEYRVVDDVESMPRNLRGLHPDNPVNRGGGGVQVQRRPVEAHDNEPPFRRGGGHKHTIVQAPGEGRQGSGHPSGRLGRAAFAVE